MILESLSLPPREGDTRNGTGSSGPHGGRTVSIFDAVTGQLVADTGSQIDAMAAAKGIYPDGRSNRVGSEPEGVDTYNTGRHVIAAVGLERANALAFINITNPRAPQVFDMIPVGSNPEGVKLIRRTNTLYALTANEAAGTLSVVRLRRLPDGDHDDDISSAGSDQVMADGSDDDQGKGEEIVESAEEGQWSALEAGVRNTVYIPAIAR